MAAIEDVFKKTFSVEEAEEVIRTLTTIREDVRAQFKKLENPTNEQQAWYDLMMAITYDEKVDIKNYIKAIRQ